MTTNNYDKIDPAIIRPGRIDHSYKFTHVTIDLLKEILFFFFPGEEIKINNIESQDMCHKKLSVSTLINTIILTNLESIDAVIGEVFSNRKK